MADPLLPPNCIAPYVNDHVQFSCINSILIIEMLSFQSYVSWQDLSAVTMLHQTLSQMSSMGNRLLEIEANGIKMTSNLAMLDTIVGNNVR